MLPHLLHILLIEDNEIEAKRLYHLLQSHMQTVVIIWVTTGEQALHALCGTGGQKRLPRPYLILLDFNLPQRTSFAFLQQLRADPDLRQSSVFVMGEGGATADKEEAYRLGIVAYLNKATLAAKPEAFVQLLLWYSNTAELLPRK